MSEEGAWNGEEKRAPRRKKRIKNCEDPAELADGEREAEWSWESWKCVSVWHQQS